MFLTPWDALYHQCNTPDIVLVSLQFQQQRTRQRQGSCLKERKRTVYFLNLLPFRQIKDFFTKRQQEKKYSVARPSSVLCMSLAILSVPSHYPLSNSMDAVFHFKTFAQGICLFSQIYNPKNQNIPITTFFPSGWVVCGAVRHIVPASPLPIYPPSALKPQHQLQPFDGKIIPGKKIQSSGGLLHKSYDNVSERAFVNIALRHGILFSPEQTIRSVN